MTKMTQTFAFAAMAATVLASGAFAQQATATSTVTTKAVVVETTVPATLVATHTVQTILASPKEGADVTLIGTIGAKTGDERYAFTDRTGMIQVEIDDKLMPANMALGQQVRIDGEIDYKGKKVEIDVERVTAI